MGAYLSEPITKKESSDEVGKNVAYGASSMQGWRISQEVSGKLCRRGGDGGNGRDVRARARARPRLSHRYLVSTSACFAGYPAATLVGSARPRRPAPRSLAAAPGDGRANVADDVREPRAQHPTLADGFLNTHTFIYQQTR